MVGRVSVCNCINRGRGSNDLELFSVGGGDGGRGGGGGECIHHTLQQEATLSDGGGLGLPKVDLLVVGCSERPKSPFAPSVT